MATPVAFLSGSTCFSVTGKLSYIWSSPETANSSRMSASERPSIGHSPTRSSCVSRLNALNIEGKAPKRDLPETWVKLALRLGRLRIGRLAACGVPAATDSELSDIGLRVERHQRA